MARSGRSTAAWRERLAMAVAAFGIAATASSALGACAGPPRPSVPPGGTDLTLYVRNASDDQVWISSLLGPDGGAGKGAGFGKTTGVSCEVLPAGSKVQLMDRPPDVGASQAVRAVLYEATGKEILAVRWLDVAADGTFATGTGVPDWRPAFTGC